MAETLRGELMRQVAAYHIPPKAVELLKQQPPLIIAGVTASGKTSIVEEIAKNTQWRDVITHTTRRPRPGEKPGKNYWFVNEAEMLGLVETEALVEANAVHGEVFYGTSIASYQAVIETGHKPILVIDVQGVEDITKQLPQIKSVFILPPSFETWMHRLDQRGHITAVEKHRRIKSAKTEIEKAIRSRHFIFIVNQEVSRTAQEVLTGGPDISSQHRNRHLAHELLEQLQKY